MLSEYKKISTLAFILCYKSHYVNSCIPDIDSINIHRIAGMLGCTSKSIKKYINLSDELGLIKKRGRSYQFISIPLILEALYGLGNQSYFLRIFTHKKSKLNVLSKSSKLKQYKDLIEKEIAKLNFSKQSFAECNNPNVNNHHSQQGGTISNGSIKSNVIVNTGAFHLANILGCHASTSQRRLTDWHNKGLINRQVVKVNVKDLVKVPKHLMKYKSLLSNAKELTFGSIITNFDNLSKVIVSTLTPPKIVKNKFYMNQYW